jgi:DNA-directed RNA polymerase II subunit RPB3
MEPIVSEITEDTYLKFRLSGVNVSIANSIRRIILSEIPCIVFRTTPHEANRVDMKINTTRMNNELLKQRLSCIPIHITDTSFPFDDYMIELNVSNETDTFIYATTGDFKMKNIQTNTYSETTAIFPLDPLTGTYIDIARLRPNEKLSLSAKFDIGTAKQDGSFNVASTCSYAFAQDIEKANQAWNEKGDTDANAKQDWMLLDGKRYTLPNTFDFIIETVGQFSNQTIVMKACDIMGQKLQKFEETLKTKGDVVNKSNSTIPHCFDVTLNGEDHTLGKVVEYAIYAKHYEGDKTVTFCGFRKPHPHIDSSVIRIAFTTPKETFDVSAIIIAAIMDLVPIYEAIGNEFKV